MRLFLIGWQCVRPELNNELAIELKRKGHDILYWVIDNANQELKSKFANTVFQGHFEAYDGIPAEDVDCSQFDPVGEVMLSQFSAVENIILPMMNKRFDWMSVSERKHRYYNILRYWIGVIKKLKPEMIVFNSPPHAIYDFIIYEFAKLFNITNLLFFETLIGDRLLIMNDFKIGSSTLLNELEKIKGKNCSLYDLNEDLREYLERQINPLVDNTPQYFKEGMAGYSLKNVMRVKVKMVLTAIKDLTIFNKAILFVIKKFKPNLQDEYLSIVSQPDFKKKFIYVPLHYQPECSTVTLGGIYDDQILMIETLSASLPGGWVIYVKEHPGQWLPRGYNFFSYRYAGYYKAIAKIKNVVLIPIKTDTFDLIQKCQVVATVTGTAGWQAVLRLKPALVFGFPWYQHCPGVFRINGVESCRNVFEEIKTNNKVEKQGIINFLYAFGQASYHGYFSDYGKRQSTLSEKENMKDILNILLAELDKIKSAYEKDKAVTAGKI